MQGENLTLRVATLEHSKCTVFNNTKNMRHTKKQESMINSQEIKALTEMVLEGAQRLDLIDKDINSTVLNILKELNESKTYGTQ